MYGMSEDELKVLKKYLDDNLAKGFIRTSSSPAASPVLFARTPGGELRLCVDYHALNAITINYKYPLPLIQEILSRICRAKVDTSLDIVEAFNKLRMAQGEEWKTAIRTRYALYEWSSPSGIIQQKLLVHCENCRRWLYKLAAEDGLSQIRMIPILTPENCVYEK